MLTRPHADKTADELLHLIREVLIKHQTGVAESTADDFDQLANLASLVEELDQRLSRSRGRLPSAWACTL